MPISQRRATLKIPSVVFRTYALSGGFKMKPRRNVMLKQKPTEILSQGLLKEATIHFYCLFDESHFSNL